MDPKSVDLGTTDHVVNISMSQEQDVNNISNSSYPKTASEAIAIDHDILSMSQEYVICLEKEINDLNTATQEPETTDADANTSVESPTCERKACSSLISGSKNEYTEICVPLYEAAITGDWEAAKVILDTRPELVRFAITQKGDTTLHVAVTAEATEQSESFVENLVQMMEIEDLEIRNKSGKPAYEMAAVKGNVHMFKVILNKHQDILTNFPDRTFLALGASAVNGNHEMTLHFYNVLEKTPLSFWEDVDRCLLFMNCINGDLFDIALKVMEDHPVIATGMKTCFVSLDILARRPDTLNRKETDTYMIRRIADSILACFHVKKNSPKMDNQALKLVQSLLKLYPISSDQHDMLDDMMYVDGIKEVLEMDMSLRGLLFTAVEMGNTRFVIELLRMFPITLYQTKDDGTSIFHIAIMRRHKGIYNLLYETGSHTGLLVRWVDNKNNNILHLVGMTSNDTAQLQTASLLMQRELLWYKEVEKMVPPLYRNSKNDDGKTPYELFSENNQELVSKGMKWTRDCMVVATLIITVAFAVAFTVPGGNNQDTGIPIFHRDASFLVFIIADAFSLFTSSTSLLVFLSILTSPHDQRDFLYAMPGKLMIGLVALFMSLAAMMVTFAASFFVIYKNTHRWLPILISGFAATPVIIFAVLQYPFVMDMFRSMFDSRYLFNTGKRVLYTKNKKL